MLAPQSELTVPKMGGSDIHNQNQDKCASPNTFQTLVEKRNPVDCQLNVGTSEAAKESVRDWGDIWTLQPGKILWRAQKTGNKVSLDEQEHVNRYGSWFATTKQHAALHIKDEQPYLAKYKVLNNIRVLYHHNLRWTGFTYIGESALGAPDPHNSKFEKECKTRFSGTPLSGYIGCNECEVYLKWLLINMGLQLEEATNVRQQELKAKKPKNKKTKGNGFQISVSPPDSSPKSGKQALYGNEYFYNDYLFSDYQRNAAKENQYAVAPYTGTAKSQYFYDGNAQPQSGLSYLAVHMEHELLFGAGIIGISGVLLLLCCILGILIVIGSGVCGLYYKSKPTKHALLSYDETDNV